MKRARSLAPLCLLLWPGHAFPQQRLGVAPEPSGPVLGIHAGASVITRDGASYAFNTGSSVFEGSGTYDYETGFAAGASLGWLWMPNMVVGADVTYRTNNSQGFTYGEGDFGTGTTGVEGRLETVSVMAESLLTTSVRNGPRLYGGIGLGRVMAIEDDLEGAYGGQLKLGVDYAVGRLGRVGVEGVYLGTFGDFERQGDTLGGSLEYGGASAMITYRLTP